MDSTRTPIVLFMGDHGRAMPRGKQWPYDSGLHIPLVIYWPEGNANLPVPKGFTRGDKERPAGRLDRSDCDDVGLGGSGQAREDAGARVVWRVS